MGKQFAEADWPSLLGEEIRARVRAKGGDAAALREWWGIMQIILDRSSRPDFEGPAPRKALKVLSAMAGYLAVGQIPDPIGNVAGRGETAPGPMELHDIRMAVTYRRSAEAGLVTDKSPVKTIVETYGLSDRTTVQKWCRQYEPLDDFEPGTLAREMKRCGERYGRAGRSQKAIRSRGRK